MKKLTAGIFTVLLGLVTVNAADAAVASKLYVDQEAGKVNTTLTNYKTANDARVLAVEGEVDTLQNQVADETNGLIKKVDTLTTTLGEVTSGKLNIQDGSITAAKLGKDAVVTDKILDANVTEAKLATDSVTETKIKDGNVTAEKLAAGAAVANIGYTPEDVANKTATIDANSTEAQYPTAKAVYTQIDQVQKDVSSNLTLIQELQDKSATKAELTSYQQTNGAAVQANTDAIATINSGAVMQSGVTAAIVGTVKTNANNIGAIAQSEFVQGLDDKTLTGAVNKLGEDVGQLWSDVEFNRLDANRMANYALDNAVAYTDAVVEAMKLKEISRVPAACSEPNKYCALTTNGSQFVWEVIERAEGETVTPATGSAYPLTGLTPDTVEKPASVPLTSDQPA